MFVNTTKTALHTPTVTVSTDVVSILVRRICAEIMPNVTQRITKLNANVRLDLKEILKLVAMADLKILAYLTHVVLMQLAKMIMAILFASVQKDLLEIHLNSAVCINFTLAEKTILHSLCI